MRPPCGDGGLCAFQDLQQRLLYALTGDIAGDGRVLALAGDLVDLVDVDDAGLGTLHVVVGGLNQLEENVLHILADIPGFGQRGGICDRERHVEHLRERLRQVGLAAAGRAEHQDIGFGQFNGLAAGVASLVPGLDALVVVVDGDSQRLLRGVLADDVVLQEVADLCGLGQFIELDVVGVGQLLFDDLVAEVDAFIADVHAGAGDELLDLLLALSAERAFQQVAAVSDTCHGGQSYFLSRGGGSWCQHVL